MNVKTIEQYLYLLLVLVKKDMKLRYKSSFLGYIWALANPLVFAAIYYFAFKVILRVEMENYSIYLLSGMFPWVWLSNSIIYATGCLRNNASLIKRVSVNRAIIPLASSMSEMLHFLLSLPALVLFMILSGEAVSASVFYLIPFVALLQLLFIYVIGLLLSGLNVLVHDVEYIVGLGISMLFFLSPIVYPTSLVPDDYLRLYELNPVVSLLNLWRGVFFDGVINLTDLIRVCAFIVVISIFAAWCFPKMSRKFGELL